MSLQPTLPPEGQFSDLELVFIEESPPRLWPENQDSNFGALRKVLTDPLQEAADLIAQLFSEMFVATTVVYFSRWEDEFDLPQARHNQIVENRRFWLKNRAIRSPFTRTRRKNLVEQAIIETFGAAVALTPDGVPIPPEGIPLYSGEFDVHHLYRIDEQVEIFHYTIHIKEDIAVDMNALPRELEWMTPSGITFEIISYIALFPEMELFPDNNLMPNT